MSLAEPAKRTVHEVSVGGVAGVALSIPPSMTTPWPVMTLGARTVPRTRTPEPRTTGPEVHISPRLALGPTTIPCFPRFDTVLCPVVMGSTWLSGPKTRFPSAAKVTAAIGTDRGALRIILNSDACLEVCANRATPTEASPVSQAARPSVTNSKAPAHRGRFGVSNVGHPKPLVPTEANLSLTEPPIMDSRGVVYAQAPKGLVAFEARTGTKIFERLDLLPRDAPPPDARPGVVIVPSPPPRFAWPSSPSRLMASLWWC